MATINVLSVIDCISIINNPGLPKGTLSSPTYIGNNSTSDAYVYMMTTQCYTLNDGGKSELKIAANVGDQVQWTMTSIDGGLQYNAILQSIDINQNAAGSMTPPYSADFQFKQYAGPPQPGNLTPISYNDYVMASDVLNNNSNNSIQYFVVFYITDHQGNILGYYKWDPFIQVV